MPDTPSKPVSRSPVTWLVNHTGGDLLLCLGLHAAINNTPRFVHGSAVFPVLLLGFIAVALVIRERMWVGPAASAAP